MDSGQNRKDEARTGERMRNDQTLKEYIIHLCKLHNTNMKELSERMTIHKATFYAVMNRKNRMSLSTYFELAELFAELSIYPEEYFLKRLKQFIQQEKNNE